MLFDHIDTKRTVHPAGTNPSNQKTELKSLHWTEMSETANNKVDAGWSNNTYIKYSVGNQQA